MATSRRHIFARVLAIQRHRSIAGWRQVLACCLLAVLFCLCTATFQATAEPAPAAQNAPPPSEPAENPAAKADLTQMIIPKVSIENGEFMEVISFLSTFARENAPEGQKLEFTVDLPDPSQLPRITVEMKQTSIAQAAQYVAKQAGLDAEISEEKIVFRASQPGSQLQSKLDSIQVEKINWLETTLHAAIAYLNAIAYEQDPEEFGVPITIGDEFDRHQTLTLQLKDVSLRRAIQETAARVNAMVGVTGDKVVLVPHNTGQSGSQDTLQVSARFVEMTQSAIEELAAEDDFFTGFSLAKTAEEAEEASLVVGKERLEEIIKMLENHEGVDLLSAPRVVTLVGQPATINITRELSYPDSIKAVGETTQLVPTEFERRNVGITMSVGSERHENGEIHLRIVPEQTYVTGYIQYPEGVQVAEYPADESARDGKVFVPIFANKTINTSAKLKDELHMAMGGLRGVSTTFAAIQGDLAQKGYGPKHPKVLGAEALKDVEEKVLLVFVSIEFQGAEPSSDSDQTRRRRVIRPFVR
jgi:Flp pilus assembly secretin CpaC